MEDEITETEPVRDIRMMRGFLEGMDTDVEREEDRLEDIAQRNEFSPLNPPEVDLGDGFLP